ncbi:MAG: tetratricopeptide repeat protein [Verrucomicrobiota bacterium]
MWKICGSFSFCLLAAGYTGSAQGGASMPPPSFEEPTRAGVSAPSGGMFESNTFLEMADRVFDPESDSMDFEEGSFAWKGRSFALSDQRAFRARFERFLLDSPSEDEAQYSRLMRDILDQLSVLNENNEDTILDTWQMLFRAAEFDADGGNSIIVANQVFNAWRVRKESRGTALSQRELEDLRRYQQEVVANRAQALQRLKEKRQRESSLARKENEGGGGEDGEALASESAFRALDLAETEAKILALEGQAEATGLQAKLQFQSQIVAFTVQRRFQHALILSGFYQLLFKGSQQQLEVGKDQLTEFFPDSDLSFTVDTLSFVAREAVNDVNSGVEAVNSAYAEDRKLISLERLQETFFLGEYLPTLNRIDKAQRRELLDIYRGMLEARELAEAKDYNGVAEAAEKLHRLASDFPLSRVLAGVETAKSMSDMAVFAASQYRNLGDIDKAREELQQAIDIWPSNPSIREFQQETTKLATSGSKGVQVFDDLYEREDRRGIYERRMDLGFALADDAERRPLLMEVVDQVARIDLYIAQAKELSQQGEVYAAWELLAEAVKIDPDDGPMNRARAELAPKVASFVGKLDQAGQHKEAGRHASALAAFLAAQDIYPASRICRIGIEDAAEALMASLAEEAEASGAN